MRNRFLILFLLFLTALCSVQAQDTPNARQARRIFNNAYQQVFGEQGATLHGTTVYTIKKKKKKKEVEIHNARNNKSDKYSSKFKFEPENFDYSIAEHEQGLMVTLKAKKGAKGIKEIHALVERKTYHPISVRIKISIIWTTIKVSNFRSGGITDEMLRFPREQFKDYEFVDKREK